MWADGATGGYLVECIGPGGPVSDVLATACPQRAVHCFGPAGEPIFTPDNALVTCGAFEDIIPHWLDANAGKVSLLHIATDDYQVSRTALVYLDRRIVRGTIIIFDAVMAKQGAFHALQLWEQAFGRRLEPLSLGPDNAAALRVRE